MAKRVIGICYGAVMEAQTAYISQRAAQFGYEVKSLPSGQFVSQIPDGWLEECEIIFGNVPEKRLHEAKNLKWLQTSSAGVDNYCVPGVLPDDVLLSNGSGGYGEGISEYMTGQMFALIKRAPEYMENQKNKIWRRQGMVGGVTGLKVTVIGLGDIGGGFAKRAHALGAVVTGVKRKKTEKPDYIEAIYTTDEIDKALEGAELVALALPGTDDAAGTLSRERIFALKQGCFIINVGRGNSIDQSALVEALNCGHLGGAALDVFEVEPIPQDNPIWDAKNIIITPHVSGGINYAPTIKNIIEIFLSNLEAYCAGQPFARNVDRKLGY